MPKLKKEEAPRPAVVEDRSTKSIGKRKRDAMEIVEKWRMVNDICDDGVDLPTVDQLKLVAMKRRKVFQESKPTSLKQSVVPTTKKPDDKVDIKTKKFFVPKDWLCLSI